MMAPGDRQQNRAHYIVSAKDYKRLHRETSSICPRNPPLDHNTIISIKLTRGTSVTLITAPRQRTLVTDAAWTHATESPCRLRAHWPFNVQATQAARMATP